MAEPVKTWWAPVWRGLVVDPAGKHVRFLGKSLALLVYLILHADRQTGVVRQRQATIARGMGFRPRTIRGWMRRLREGGYVALTGTGRATVMRIAKWRSLQALRQERADQTGRNMPLRAAQIGHSPNVGTPKAEHPSGEIEGTADPNKSLYTRDLIQQHGAGQKKTITNGRTNGRGAQSQEELLARDLARGLGDEAHYSRYLGYTRRFPERVLRRLLSEARAVPEQAITRSRPGLFAYLLTRYVHQHSTDSRD